MSEKGADIRMKWLRKRKQTDQVEANEATPDLEVHKQDENVANNEAKYIDDKKTSSEWPARAVPVAADEPILEVRDVERSFQVGSQKLHVLKGINMEVHPGQLVMLKGRSGSGKTTLLNMLGGLDLPTKGEIYFRGEELSSWSDNKRTYTRRNDIGFIFQAFALMPLLSAYENVELSLRMANIPRHLWKERVQHCLELVGLGKRMKHRPFEMSGGEQQRVAIAKSIAHKPLLLLADEPTAELDSQMGAQVMGVFRQIIRSEQIAICMTTHDPTILEVADHVYEMVDGKFIS
ncbi:ABC transporter ATP-binding protein [Paenibacillus alvei]|uniref:ABC transporter ATP-binding protein n=1 Tax=Paenibacillus alvei TaxID=44250 RepID=A0ABT4GUH4_PAEAL|nr:ABC transporter ATP-binding protein [Paenibacillus alvei]MCY7487060.1 ABC transporter ATP-binding protein [Paenibacillus alvei]MCY9541465.1 ABC transporter ATP-binding protein [Paenibacillus alvei]MCY9705586.1 ABC transporter ATP-binding protein [Paenibacillus alvei]MCY9734822.1 ABC transporter ATP-binding protein [Paenibacillus alvei]MCY9757893.1 ABC transporter ATP-binding protein [Paenibacillus alvei]